MKLQLDTDKKTIKIEESVNIGEFLKTLNQLLPNELWKEFTLEVVPLSIDWPQNPIIIPQPYVPPVYPMNPVYPTYPPINPLYPDFPWITCVANDNERIYAHDNNFSLNKGVFNVEV